MLFCLQGGVASGYTMYCDVLESVVNCGQPESIKFGSVDALTTTEDSVAIYTCEDSYQLIGVSVRVCLSSGKWSGKSPVCTSKHQISQ